METIPGKAVKGYTYTNLPERAGDRIRFFPHLLPNFQQYSQLLVSVPLIGLTFKSSPQNCSAFLLRYPVEDRSRRVVSCHWITADTLVHCFSLSGKLRSFPNYAVSTK
ncbi:MAG TPA: hypothetical protein V6C85_31570 [Allocoleopsis sp.]